ncbi:MAG: hypothetical protein LBJ00_04450 [Planctomycetaceae bacterium]|jgi:hypothetical protein|nr:hypothetical protein [Planctomycetaceae bacterium]
MTQSQKIKIHVIVFIIEIAILLCFFLLKNNELLLICFGLLLFASVPSIGIIGLLLGNSKGDGVSKLILKFNIACQIIIVLLPSLLYVLSFLYINNREQPMFLVIATFCAAIAVLFCVLLSIVSNIVYAITNQKSVLWDVLLQFIYLGVAIYSLYIGDKMVI